MIFKVGQETGRGKFVCTRCGGKIILSSDSDTLKVCSICSNDEYEGDIVFDRFDLHDKFDEVIQLLESSIFLYEAVEIEPFLNVIASQLRLLLCDTHQGQDISILPKVVDVVEFHPCKSNYLKVKSDNPDNKMILARDMFDYEAEPIELKIWLNQEILFNSDEKSPITVREIIKYYANKNGGAHIDEELRGRELFTIYLSESYLLEIGKYIIKWLNRDIVKDVRNKLVTPFTTWFYQNQET